MNSQQIDRLVKKAEQMQTIRDTTTMDRQALGFFTRLLLLTTLPHAEPKTKDVYTTTNGQYHLGIRSGYDIENENKKYGIPFGIYPRLLLAFICKEVIMKKSKTIHLGQSLNQFMEKLGIAPSYDGKKNTGSITRLRDQMDRLFNADIIVKRVEQTAFSKKSAQLKYQIVDGMQTEEIYFWDKKTHPDQKQIFDTAITLSDTFFEEIKNHPVPIDLDILSAIKTSPLAIDLYLFLTYNSFKVKQKIEVSWKSLHQQFGSEYTELKNFTREAKKHLKKICMLYPDLHIELPRGKIVILPTSTPSVELKP